jgi:hypothetical protein
VPGARGGEEASHDAVILEVVSVSAVPVPKMTLRWPMMASIATPNLSP